MNYAQIFSKNVLIILEKMGKPLFWLSKQPNISQATPYHLPKKDYNPTIETMEQISKILKIPLLLLLDPNLFENDQSSPKILKEQLPKNHVLFLGIIPDFEALPLKRYDKTTDFLQKKLSLH